MKISDTDDYKVVSVKNRPWDYKDIKFWQNPTEKTNNAIINFNGRKTRLRAAMLIVKDGKEILLAEEKDEPGVFSLPGGGIEPGETVTHAAKREAQEEVKATVINIKDTGYDYCECHSEVKDWVRKHVPVTEQWYNYYTCLCIGDYVSDFTGDIDRVDLDPHMESTSKFYPIKEVINNPSFKTQWKKALFDAGYIKRRTVNESFKKLDIEGVRDPVYVTDEAYKVANLIKRGDTAYRIFVEPHGENTEYYLTNGENNVTHSSLLVALNKAGWTIQDYLSMPEEDLPFDDSQTIVAVPEVVDRNNMVYGACLGDDGYCSVRVYEFGEVFVRSSKAYKWDLFKALGKPIRTVTNEDNYNKVISYVEDTDEIEFVITRDDYIHALMDDQNVLQYATWTGNYINDTDFKTIDKELGLHESIQLNEVTRNQLIAKSRNVGAYKDQKYGKNRFERKKRSKVATQVKSFNQIDMNQFFKQDVLEVTVPVIGETDTYNVTVKMEGVVAEIAKNIKAHDNKLEYRTIIQSITKIFNTSNVWVKCTCDDFLYRFDHWSVVNGYGVDDTAHDPGPGKGIANPNNDKGIGCKHILLVLANVDWIMKVASVINNYIHYAEKNMQQAFLKIIFPKLYGTPADAMVEDGLVGDDKYLDSSAGLIDAINAYGRNRGKFAPGTNKNPVTGTGGKTALKKPTDEPKAEEKKPTVAPAKPAAPKTAVKPAAPEEKK